MVRNIHFMFLALMVAGCNFAPLPQGGASPTVEQITLTVAPVEPTDTPSPTDLPEAVIVETATPSPSPGPPTLPPEPTDTPGPYEHVIQAQDTLLYIIQQYGYTDFGVVDEIVRINDNITNPDFLPGPGSVILIPRQTAVPTIDPLVAPPTAVVDNAIAPTDAGTGLNVDVPIIQHIVLEDQTMVDIAANYATTLEVLSRLNPDIGFWGCNFEIPSGGPGCNPLLQVVQDVNVPAPTPTPTLSPTPSGSETPTMTPTYAAPRIISPPQDAVVPAGIFRLEWVGVGVLQPEEVYLVEIEDTVTGEKFRSITTSTSLPLPEAMIPTGGEPHAIHWTITVAKPNKQGAYRVISGSPVIRRFQWQSR